MLRKTLTLLPALLVAAALPACATRVETPEGRAFGDVDTDGGVRTDLGWKDYDPDRRGNWDVDVDRR